MTNTHINPLALSAQHYLLARAWVALPPFSGVFIVPIQATVNIFGAPVSGATVFIVNATQGSVVAEKIADSNGQVSVDVAGQHSRGDLYHVCAEYDDGGTYYNGNSIPFINPEV